MKLRLWILWAGTLLLSAAVEAATVYRWVDEAGQVHFSDVVPEAYKKVAQPMELKVAEPSPAEKADADARAAALKARADAIVVPSRDGEPAEADPPSRTTEAFQYTATNCKAWRQRYTESKACFDGLAPAADGRTSTADRPCGEDVPNPYPVCGAPENYEIGPSDFPWLTIPPRRRH